MHDLPLGTLAAWGRHPEGHLPAHFEAHPGASDAQRDETWKGVARKEQLLIPRVLADFLLCQLLSGPAFTLSARCANLAFFCSSSSPFPFPPWPSLPLSSPISQPKCTGPPRLPSSKALPNFHPFDALVLSKSYCSYEQSVHCPVIARIRLSW